jgi:hypothetical protein
MWKFDASAAIVVALAINLFTVGSSAVYAQETTPPPAGMAGMPGNGHRRIIRHRQRFVRNGRV